MISRIHLLLSFMSSVRLLSFLSRPSSSSAYPERVSGIRMLLQVAWHDMYEDEDGDV